MRKLKPPKLIKLVHETYDKILKLPSKSWNGSQRLQTIHFECVRIHSHSSQCVIGEQSNLLINFCKAFPHIDFAYSFTLMLSNWQCTNILRQRGKTDLPEQCFFNYQIVQNKASNYAKVCSGKVLQLQNRSCLNSVYNVYTHLSKVTERLRIHCRMNPQQSERERKYSRSLVYVMVIF